MNFQPFIQDIQGKPDLENSLSLGSLFSGIGGFELGFERTGKIKIIWQVEIDEYCRRVLAKHWPAVQRFADIRDVGKHNLPYADILCGGFPCQDISNAGKRAGIDGERSGLWSEYARVIRELRPRYVVVENVAALLGRGMERVLGDLAACGYDAEWQSIRASDVGAPHRRERIWIVAYPSRDLRRASRDAGYEPPYGRNPILADAERDGRRESAEVFRGWESELAICGEDVPDDDCARLAQFQGGVGRVAHGIPARVDRLRGLGNAIIPQIAEWIGHRIVVDAFSPVTNHQSLVTAVSL